MRIGFAGLGRMGALMAQNLIDAGHEVVVWNRSADKAVAFSAAAGCPCVKTPAELMQRTEVVVTMLADDPASEAVHFGPNGLFSGTDAARHAQTVAKHAHTIVEMGTLSPDHIASLADHAPPGVAILDAPVSGATQAAKARSLLIMAGCTQADGTPLALLFDAMGKQTIYLGKQGAGAVMKLAVNTLIHGINQTFAEAMSLAEAAGIAPTDAFDVVEASAACAPMLSYRRPLYLDEASHDVTFTVALARKDMQVTAALASVLGVAMPQGRTTLTLLQQAEAAGYGPRDMAAMLSFMRQETP